ncbi:MAG: protein kinase [Geothrix sp.]|nr:protein kinase [Geothrix sp.]
MLRRLGRFELLKGLGQGAMGEVYLGLDPAIGREVAIKTIHREAAQGAEARERFAREARAAGTLNHPNLVTIHEFGEDQGVLYLAMEFVPGEDLETLLRNRALAPAETLEVLAQVCDGLAYAHQKGVLHRDIKPSNIRVRREGERLFAKVMDFGIARVAGSDMTGTGTLLGTFGYMAPEYIRTGVPDPRSDLFAVGVILYEALAGRRPFDGDTTATVLYRVVNEEPAPLAPSDLQGISPQAGLLLAKALAKEPARRFPTAEAMARALRGARDPAWAGLPGSLPTRALARPAGPAAESSPARRRRAWPWIAAAMILGALGLGAWSQLRGPRAPKLLPQASALPLPAAPQAPGPALPPPVTAPPAGEVEPELRPSPPEGAARPAPLAPAARKAAPGPVQPPEPRPLSDQEASELLDEAARGLADQPQGSLALCDRVIRDHPGNARAYALKAVALYGLGRYQEMPGVLDAGRECGVRPGQYLAFGHFTAMLREERRERRMPPEVRQTLVAGLPLGTLRPGQGARAPWSSKN